MACILQKRVTHPTTKVKTGKFSFEALLGDSLFARLILKYFIETRENGFSD